MTLIVSLVTLPCRFHQQSVTLVRPTGCGVWSVRDARDASTASFYIKGGDTRYTGNVVNGIRVSEVASATSGKPLAASGYSPVSLTVRRFPLPPIESCSRPTSRWRAFPSQGGGFIPENDSLKNYPITNPATNPTHHPIPPA